MIALDTRVWALLALMGYLLGSVPSAYLVGRRHGLDIRRHGSGNVGAMNTLRTLGAAAGLAVVLLDCGKGLAAVALAAHWRVDATGQAWAGAWAVIGHVFPLFLGFRGGKGLATGAAVLLWLSPPAAGLSLLTLAGVLAITRHVAVASVAAATLAPAFAVMLGAPARLIAVLVGLTGIIVWSHWANLRRVLAGTEPKIGQR